MDFTRSRDDTSLSFFFRTRFHTLLNSTPVNKVLGHVLYQIPLTQVFFLASRWYISPRLKQVALLFPPVTAPRLNLMNENLSLSLMRPHV